MLNTISALLLDKLDKAIDIAKANEKAIKDAIDDMYRLLNVTDVIDSIDSPFVSRCSFSLIYVYSSHLETFSSSTPSLVALLPLEWVHWALGLTARAP
jgi:hypothetical protein